MSNCSVCNKPPQLSVISDCGTGCVYCFLCLKDYIKNTIGSPMCVCGQPMSIDVDNVSEDFRTTLRGLQGNPVWMYSSNSGDGWWMYNLKTSEQLERCFSGGLPTCSFQIGSKTYNANFSTGMQTLITAHPSGNDIKQRPMQRVLFDNDIIDQKNIKGIAGIFFKTIEDEIGKFV